MIFLLRDHEQRQNESEQVHLEVKETMRKDNTSDEHRQVRLEDLCDRANKRRQHESDEQRERGLQNTEIKNKI